MDIFRDYFTRENLVRSLAQAPHTPGRLGELGIFETVNLTSTTFAVEEQAKNTGKVLTAIARGAPRQKTGLDKRKVHTFATKTFGDSGEVYADEVLNARGAGTNGAAEVIQNRIDSVMAKVRRNVDLTLESERMTCLLAPGSTEFGSAAAAATIAVQTTSTKVRQEIFNKLTKPIEAALDGVNFTGLHAFCSDGFWAELIENEQIKTTYLNWQAAAELRGDTRQVFSYGGVMWERYRGTSAVKITDDRAIVFPVGASELFWQAFAPTDVMESVGSGALGQPYYVGSAPIKDALGTKGMEVAIQSHPVMVCGRPAAIIPVKMS